jgi:menaquinone-dependent protoporphyrinogen oxidase
MTLQGTRRRFLKNGLLVVAGVGVVACGGGAIVNAATSPKIELPSKTFGEKTLSKRVLVAYASKAGSTAEIAVRVGELLSKRGALVDVKRASEVADLSPYGAVVLGSAVRMGQVLPEALTFVRKHSAVLAQKPFDVFVACLTMKEETDEARSKASGYLEPVRALAKPAHEGLFAGAVLPARLNLLDRLMVRMIQAPTGDFRKWDRIEAWSADVAAL